MTFEPASDEFTTMLRHACLAGACAIVSRREPASAKVLSETADYHSREAARLLGKLKRLPICQDREGFRPG